MEANAPSVETSAGGFPSRFTIFFFFFMVTEEYHYIKYRPTISTFMSHYFFLLKI